MEGRGERPVFPPVAHRHLISWWLEIGPTTATGMGDGPICWQEMSAWQALKGIELSPWEATAIRAMSEAFIGQRHEAKKPSCPPPFSLDVPKEVRDRVTLQFEAMVSGLGKNEG